MVANNWSSSFSSSTISLKYLLHLCHLKTLRFLPSCFLRNIVYAFLYIKHQIRHCGEWQEEIYMLFFSTSRYSDDSMHACVLSRVWLFVTLWTVAHQAPLSMGFSRQEYWSGLPFPFPGDLPHSGIEVASPATPALAGGFFTTEPPETSLSGEDEAPV